MNKQFDLQIIQKNTLVEKFSQLPLKYKKIFKTETDVESQEETDVLEKIIVGLPVGKTSQEWETLVVKKVRLFHQYTAL